MGIFVILLKIIVTWLITDWVSGFVHWVEDSYGHPFQPFVGRRVTKPNLLHHYRPRAFVNNSWYASAELLLAACVVSLLIALVLGRLTPMVILAAVLGANANQIHKWSHCSKHENGALIVALQRLKFIQSPDHHSKHHLNRRDSHYCVLTDFMNPILDACKFWRGLENLVNRLLGIKKRDDDAMLLVVLAQEPEFLGDISGERMLARRSQLV
jgi:ubiquitin-conjugating enzyme E2 variant